MATPDLTAARLRESVSYNPNTGQFQWLVTRGRAVAGRTIASKPKNGYQVLKIDGTAYQAHRCAWLYVHGCWPMNEIDHINGHRGDNRLSNLRDVTKVLNQQNVAAPRIDNAAGLRGVFKHKDCARWVAQIMVNKRQKYLGLFATPEEASAAYQAAKAAMHPHCARTDTKALLGHASDRAANLYADPRGVEALLVKLG